MSNGVEISDDYEDVSNEADETMVYDAEEGKEYPKAESPVDMTYRETEQRATALNIATAGFANTLNPTGVVAAAETFLAFLQGEAPPDISSVEYPIDEGDVIIIGPECFTDKDRTVISWRGENYVSQQYVQHFLSSQAT